MDQVRSARLSGPRARRLPPQSRRSPWRVRTIDGAAETGVASDPNNQRHEEEVPG